MARILIGVPQHGGMMSAQAFSSVLTSASHGKHDIQFNVMGLSLLARNFNQLFIAAWRNKFDAFVLHHSDLGVRNPEGVVSEGSWVDRLVDRLFEKEAAVMAGISPIKSMAGHTSFGLDLENSSDNPYSLRRVTCRQLVNLPDTITREDVCRMFGVQPEVAGAMLINTGVMAMNLKDYNWVGWPGFQIEDRIGWKRDGSACQAFTEPEDWRLSRWLHAKGWPYYAVKDFMISHVGCHTYQNTPDWGDDADHSPLQSSLKEYER